MEIFTFDRAERAVSAHGSTGLTSTRIAHGAGPGPGPGPGPGATAGTFLAHLSVEAGGVIGTHPATGSQLFLLLTGSGWVAGPDGVRVPLTAGQGARWAAGELHTSGTDTGFTALALEGPELSLFPPEACELEEGVTPPA
jgi:hypothetical protein